MPKAMALKRPQNNCSQTAEASSEFQWTRFWTNTLFAIVLRQNVSQSRILLLQMNRGERSAVGIDFPESRLKNVSIADLTPQL